MLGIVWICLLPPMCCAWLSIKHEINQNSCKHRECKIKININIEDVVGLPIWHLTGMVHCMGANHKDA